MGGAGSVSSSLGEDSAGVAWAVRWPDDLTRLPASRAILAESPRVRDPPCVLRVAWAARAATRRRVPPIFGLLCADLRWPVGLVQHPLRAQVRCRWPYDLTMCGVQVTRFDIKWAADAGGMMEEETSREPAMGGETAAMGGEAAMEGGGFQQESGQEMAMTA